MKIYSQIKSQPDPPPAEGESARHSQFSFHHNNAYSNSDMPRSQISDSSSNIQKSKFSFKLQPQLYFQRNNPQKDKLFQAPSHIRVASSSSDKSEKEECERSKSLLNRKKIFDQSMRVTVLNQKQSKDASNAKQQEVPAIVISQQVPKMVKDENKPIVSILKKHIQHQQPSSIINNSSFYNSRKNIRRVQFTHEGTDKYLTKPILQEDIPHRLPKQAQPIKYSGQMSKDYPLIMEKLQKNERHWLQLSEKLDKKIAQDNQRNQYLNKLLSEGALKAHQKDMEIQNYQRQINKVNHQKTSQRERINMEIQQSKRLQELIMQNRHLCAKVLQQSSQKHPPSASPQELQIQQRIKELQNMRQSLQQNRSLNQSQSLHLNQSIVPQQQLNITAPQMIQSKQQRRQTPVSNSTLTVNPHSGQQYLNTPTFQMIPERDPPVNANVTQIKRIVLVSKIY